MVLRSGRETTAASEVGRPLLLDEWRSLVGVRIVLAPHVVHLQVMSADVARMRRRVMGVRPRVVGGGGCAVALRLGRA